DPSRAVCPFRILLTQILIIEKPFFFQQSEFLEERLDEFGEFQLGGGLRLKLDRAECISDHIGGHGSRGSCLGWFSPFLLSFFRTAPGKYNAGLSIAGLAAAGRDDCLRGRKATLDSRSPPVGLCSQLVGGLSSDDSCWCSTRWPNSPGPRSIFRRCKRAQLQPRS